MALAARRTEPGLIHHSDQAAQYATTEYVARLEEAGALFSIAAAVTSYENAEAESFCKTLKIEKDRLKENQNFGEAEETHASSKRRSTTRSDYTPTSGICLR